VCDAAPSANGTNGLEGPRSVALDADTPLATSTLATMTQLNAAICATIRVASDVDILHLQS
jgi:hypothetical protein